MFSDINECENSPCQNEGRCTDSEGSFSCNCTDGWEGPVCDQSNHNACDKTLFKEFKKPMTVLSTIYSLLININIINNKVICKNLKNEVCLKPVYVFYKF